MRAHVVEDMELRSVQAMNGIAVHIGDGDVGKNDADVCMQCVDGGAGRLSPHLECGCRDPED